MLTMVVLVAMGATASHLRLLPPGTRDAFEQFIMRVGVPALVVVEISGIRGASQLVVPAVSAWVAVAASATLVLALSRLLRWERRLTGTMLLIVPLGNTTLVGFPAVELFLGSEHLPAAIAFDQVGTFLAFASYGVVVASRFGSAPTTSLGGLVGRIFRFPPFVGLVTGLSFALVPGVQLPEMVLEVLRTLGATVVPLGLIAVGWRLEFTRRAWRPGLTATALGIKMLLAPVVVAAVLMAAGIERDAAAVGILQAGMPPMALSVVLVADASLDAEFASRTMVLGVAVALVTLPAVAAATALL